MKKTTNGVRYKLLSPLEIHKFDGYERDVANAHIKNIDFIIVDDNDTPIGDTQIINKIINEIKSNRFIRKYTEEEIMGEINQVAILLTKDKFPMAYSAKFNELIGCGFTQEDATNFLATTPIRLDVYYSTEKDYEGLFAVESEIVECAVINNPYSGTPLREFK